MNVTGTRKTHATYLVKDGGSGASSLTIANASTGETVVWNNALGAGEWLRLKSEGQIIEVSADSGSNWTARPENTTGIVPQLQGGENNAITVTGVSGTCAIDYTPME